MSHTPFDPGLEGSVALVTGGARGIGRGIAELLLEAGCIVHVLDVDHKAMKAWERKADPKGTLHFHRADVGESNEVRAVFRSISKLDILINNAGTPGYQPFDKLTMRDWERALRVNLTGAFICTKAASSRLARSRHGAIVNVSSIEAHLAETATVHYTSAKGGLEAFTRSAAVELAAREIRVNAVSPGAITVEHNAKTFATARSRRLFRQRIPLGGTPGSPLDVARAAMFLASPLARYITGTTLMVDGGWSVHA